MMQTIKSQFVHSYAQFIQIVCVCFFSTQLWGGNICDDFPGAVVLGSGVGKAKISSAVNPGQIVFQGTLIIDGNLDIDLPFFQVGEGSLIMLRSNASITIKRGSLFYVSGTSITGCESMWKEILVQPKANLIFSDVYVADGKRAITLQDSSNFQGRLVTFDNNTIGVFIPPNKVKGHLNYIGFNLSDGFFTCTTGGLKEKFPQLANTSYTGIEIHDCAKFALGNNPYPWIVNQHITFHNLQNGVISYDSNLSFANHGNLFKDIRPAIADQDNPYFGNAILFLSSGLHVLLKATGNQKSLFGGPGGHADDVAFVNCRRGIRLEGGDAEIAINKFRDCDYGVVITNTAMFEIKVYNNQIVNPITGIDVVDNQDGLHMYIDGNTITTGSLPKTEVTTGIRVAQTGSKAYTITQIKGNEINIERTCTGILVSAMDNVLIEGNTCIIKKPKLDYVSGILLKNGSHYCYVENNTITTSTVIASLDPSDRTGIYINWCEGTYLCSNTFDKVTTSLLIVGECDQSTIGMNNFKGGYFGLVLGLPGEPALCGKQYGRINQWTPGAYQSWDAWIMDKDPFYIQKSEFRMTKDDSKGNVTEWPDKIKNNINWINKVTNQETLGCTAGFGGGGGDDQMIQSIEYSNSSVEQIKPWISHHEIYFTDSRIQSLKLYQCNGVLLASSSSSHLDLPDITMGVYLLHSVSDEGVEQVQRIWIP